MRLHWQVQLYHAFLRTLVKLIGPFSKGAETQTTWQANPVGRTQNGSNLCGVFAKGLQGLSASSRDPSHDRDESFIYV